MKRFISQHVASGSRFVNGNVVIRITKIFIPSRTNDEPLRAAPPTADNLQPFDPNGTYVIEAYLRAEDGISNTLREKAIAELLAFVKSVDGSIDLRMTNRLALDTAVKG